MPSFLFTLLFLSVLLSLPPSLSSRPIPKTKQHEHSQITILPYHPNTTWQSFDHFIGLDVGSRVDGISDLKRYLHRFGYLPEPSSNFSNTYDADFQSAISAYQSKHSLAVTGRLDRPTLSQIASPRCGVSDETSKAHAVDRFAYFTGQPRWARPSPITLTYAISPSDTIDYIARADVDAAVRRAFERWAKVIPVGFRPAKEYEAADVKLGFYYGAHGDGEPFDGVLGVLAHAFAPESGRVHLDAAERWAVDFDKEGMKTAVDLESVATHEIGHVLGLGHSAVGEAVMYPSLSPRTKKFELTVDDVKGVQALYGSNPNFKFSSLLESDTSSAGSVMVGGSYYGWGSYGWVFGGRGVGILLVVLVVFM